MLQLTAEWKKSEEALTIPYRLQNSSPKRVLCFTCLFNEAPSGERTIDPTKAFVEIDRQGHVHVDLLTPELPEDVDVEAPVVPYAVLIEPGAAATGEVVLPLPLAERRPYPYGPPRDLPKQSTTAELRVGYVEFSEDAVPAKAIDFQGRTVYSLRAALAFERQKTITANRVSLDVPIAQTR